RVERLDGARETADGTTLAVAHVRVSSEITGETREVVYALAHFGGHDFSCGVRSWDDQATYDALKADLLARCARQSVADLVRVLEQQVSFELLSVPELTAIPYRVAGIGEEAKALGLTLDLMPQRFVMQSAVARVLALVAELPSRERVAQATALIEGARRLGIRYGHWAAQNRFFQIWSERPDARGELLPLATALGFS